MKCVVFIYFVLSLLALKGWSWDHLSTWHQGSICIDQSELVQSHPYSQHVEESCYLILIPILLWIKAIKHVMQYIDTSVMKRGERWRQCRENMKQIWWCWRFELSRKRTGDGEVTSARSKRDFISLSTTSKKPSAPLLWLRVTSSELRCITERLSAQLNPHWASSLGLETSQHASVLSSERRLGASCWKHCMCLQLEDTKKKEWKEEEEEGEGGRGGGVGDVAARCFCRTFSCLWVALWHHICFSTAEIFPDNIWKKWLWALHRFFVLKKLYSLWR